MTRINHNISSLQAMHSLIANQNSLSVSLQRLSTGLKINSGKDDPAGLIASENLRGEIQSINSAIDNSTRANNVISTAEGALNEVSALLVQIRGLITTSSNTGALSDEERQANQLQVDSILGSIDRISNTTQFNGKKLLDGSLQYTLSGVKTSALSEVRLYSARPPETGGLPIVVQVTASAQVAQLKFTGAGLPGASAASIRITGTRGSEVLSFAGSTHTSAIAVAINRFRDVLGVSATTSGTTGLYFNSTEYGSNAFVTVENIGSYQFQTQKIGGPLGISTTANGVDASVMINGQMATVDGLVASVKNSSLDMEVILTSGLGTQKASTSFGVTGGGAVFQLSPTVNRQGQASLGIYSVSTGTLGNHEVGYLSSLGTGNVNSLVTADGVTAQRILDRAIMQVSAERGRLGAFQKNTIEPNVNSLQIALENVTSSESAIRDTDFASETAAMTRAQILSSATTTVLKLANASPQNILALLQ
ncbi:MAG: flagellin [Phycisphaerae bacterium]